MPQKPKDPTAKTYVPVDTDLVDNLEHYVLDKIRVRIEYVDHTGTAEVLNGLIADVFTAERAEFLTMTDGRKLRLDQIKTATPHDPNKH